MKPQLLIQYHTLQGLINIRKKFEFVHTLLLKTCRLAELLEIETVSCLKMELNSVQEDYLSNYLLTDDYFDVDDNQAEKEWDSTCRVGPMIGVIVNNKKFLQKVYENI